MKTLTMCVLSALALAAGSSVYAADANKALVSRDYTDTVAPAQQAAYEAGEKAYNQCLHQHGFKYSVMAVTHRTGNNTMYSYEIGPVAWADFDTIHASAEACNSVVEREINPHLQSETSSFAVMKPGFSRLPKDMSAYGLTEIIHFTLKPGMAAQKAFTNGMTEIYAAQNKSNWPEYSSLSEIKAGGPDAPDFELAIFYKNWADLGAKPNPPLWKMVANVYGQAKGDEIRQAMDSAIASTEEHVDRNDPTLSYIAGK